MQCGGFFGRSATRLFLTAKLLQRRYCLMTLFLVRLIGVDLDVKPRSVGTIGSRILILL